MKGKPRGYMLCDYDLCMKGKGAHTGNELVVTRAWPERNETVNGDKEEGDLR